MLSMCVGVAWLFARVFGLTLIDHTAMCQHVFVDKLKAIGCCRESIYFCSLMYSFAT